MNKTKIEINSIDNSSMILLEIKDKLYASHSYRRASVKLESSVFNAHLSNFVITETELKRFIDDFKKLEETRQGSVSLSDKVDDTFSLTFRSIDKLGHFEVALWLGLENDRTNSLNYSFEFDPSSLRILLFHLQGCEDAIIPETKSKSSNHRQQAQVINEFLEEWDFIGVISPNHKDEYTDLINPVLTMLQNNFNEKDIADSISKTITSHYGIKMKATDEDVMLFTKRVLEWWNGGMLNS